MSRTAVVILNYNGAAYLRKFLPSVVACSPEAEVIVADNGSTDNSIEVLKREFPGVRLILFDQNYGFCGGYNRALQQVTDADYYVLLNSDIEVTPDWLPPLIRLLDNNAGIAAVHPKILSYHQPSQFEYAGAAGGYIDALGYPFCRGRMFRAVETDSGQYNDQRPVFWATGACLLIRAELYHQLGGLDEDFFAHMEEIDLCWKLQRSNHQVYYCGLSTIYHVGAGTLGYDHPRKTYLNFRNGLSLILKHFDTAELVYKFPVRLALDWLAAVVFLAQRKPANAGAVLRAHVHFFWKSFRRDWRKRKAIRRTYPSYPRTTVYRGSIIFDHYIRRKSPRV